MSDRRSLTRRTALGLIGAGGLLSVAHTLGGTNVSAGRTTDLESVDDPNAYLGLEGHGDVESGETRDQTLEVLNNTNSLSLDVTVTTTNFSMGGYGGSTQESFTLSPTDTRTLEFFPEEANSDAVTFEADLVDGTTTVGTIDLDRSITVAFQDGEVYRIEAAHSGLVMDVAGGASNPGANVEQWNWWGGDRQQWEVVSTGGSYRLIPQHANNRALGVQNGSTAEGASLVQRQSNGNPGQDIQWDIVQNLDGTYRLINEGSGYVTDVEGGTETGGTDVIQWSWKGENADDANQKWIFKPIA